MNKLNVVVALCVVLARSAAVWGAGVDDGWDNRFAAPAMSGQGLDGPVYALLVVGSDVYAGGAFTNAGGTSASNIAKWNGSAWSALGAGTDGDVRAIARIGSDLYVGGLFTNAGGVTVNHIAKWDGSTWSAVGTGTNGTGVHALAVIGSDLYVGGAFQTAGGNPINRLAKWNGSSWSGVGPGLNGPVYALAVSGSDLYVGGTFTGAPGLKNILRWDGNTYDPLMEGLCCGPDEAIYAIATKGSTIFAAGNFIVGGEHIAEFRGGVGWKNLGAGRSGGANGVVRSLVVVGDDLYAGGDFSVINNPGFNDVAVVNASNVAKWKGSSWSAVGSGIERAPARDDTVFALASDGTDVYLGGAFRAAGGESASKFTILHPVCGNGLVDIGEPCDDANVNDSDGCTTTCTEACVAPVMNLTSWWPGDGTNADITGGRNATLRNGAAYGTGQVGQAFELDGSDDYIMVPHSSALDFGTGNFTVDLWAKLDSITNEQVLIEKYVEKFDNQTLGWSLTVAGDSFLTFYAKPDQGVDSGFQNIPVGVWNHFAVRRSAGLITLFLNGVAVGSGESTGNLSSLASLKIGHRGTPSDTPGSLDASGRYADGKIDEVHIAVGQALSDAQIQSLYAAGTAGQCVPAATCGNGLLQAGEECDDSNLVNGDGCDADCTSTCGNGTVTSPEVCDDGNAVDGDGCDSNCTVTACGNHVETDAEPCDDGNLTDGDGCDSNCTPSACGNAVIAGPEECDDGNLIDGDGCDSNCTLTGCGNGIPTAGETCPEDTEPNISWDVSLLSGAADGAVNAIAVNGGDVYIGGEFGEVAGIDASNIAKWNGSVWSALGDGLDDEPLAMTVLVGEVYVGGRFTEADGNPAAHIAKWNGSAWSALGNGMDNDVLALAVIGSDLYAGGRFTMAGGSAAHHVAKWNGSTWSSLGGGTNGTVRALAVIGSDLYAAGPFTDAGSTGAAWVAKWNGSAWSTVSGLSSYVNALATSGSNLYAGGFGYVQMWNGSSWTDLGFNSNADVRALAVIGSNLYAGGDFDVADGIIAHHLAQWDGAEWSALGSGTDGAVYDLLAVSADLYVGGELQTAGGKPAGGFAVWHTASCGNAVIEVGEGCDDGDLADGDGCDSNCTLTSCGNGVLTAGEVCDDNNDTSADGCDNNCQPSACGNGFRAGSESCDDGNVANGDGCQADCTYGSISGASGTLSTDVGMTGATQGFPLQTSVTTSSAGMITIGPPSAPETPGGMQVLGLQLQIDAPDATVNAPLVIVLTVDVSAIPEGVDASRLDVIRDGVAIEDCTGAPGIASPDPCIADREVLIDGDVEITVLTSHASLWGVVVRGLGSGEQKCSNGVAGAGAKVAKAQSGANKNCLKAAAKGEEPDAEGCLTADAKGKIAGAKTKTTDTAAGKCVPPPPFGFTAAATVNNAAQQAQLGLLVDLFGSDLNSNVVSALDKQRSGCQASVLKAMTNLFNAETKLFLGCQKGGLSGKTGLVVSTPQLAGCFDVLAADVSGKIAGAVAKLEGTIADKCGELLAPALTGECGTSATCLDSRVECRICRMFNAIDGLSENCDRFDDGRLNGSCQ